MVVVLEKMGPWKFHLHNAWMEVCPRSRRSHRLSEEDTATRTAVSARILQTVANICASADFAKWVENVWPTLNVPCWICVDAAAFEIAGAYKELTALQAIMLRQAQQLYTVLCCGDLGLGTPKM